MSFILISWCCEVLNIFLNHGIGIFELSALKTVNMLGLDSHRSKQEWVGCGSLHPHGSVFLVVGGQRAPGRHRPCGKGACLSAVNPGVGVAAGDLRPLLGIGIGIGIGVAAEGERPAVASPLAL